MVFPVLLYFCPILSSRVNYAAVQRTLKPCPEQHCLGLKTVRRFSTVRFFFVSVFFLLLFCFLNITLDVLLISAISIKTLIMSALTPLLHLSQPQRKMKTNKECAISKLQILQDALQLRNHCSIWKENNFMDYCNFTLNEVSLTFSQDGLATTAIALMLDDRITKPYEIKHKRLKEE